MSALGLTLLALAGTPAAPPAPPAEKIALAGPRYSRGDEMVYRGEVIETTEGIASRVVKRYRLDVRMFVLEAAADGYDWP